jgi:subtilisin family serine protease
MRKRLLNLVLAIALVLVSVAPAFAQDDPDVPDNPQVPNQSNYLPLLLNGSGEVEVTAADEAVDSASSVVRPATAPESLAVPAGTTVDDVVSPALKQATGRVQLVVRLAAPSAAEVVAAGNVQAADVAASAVAAEQSSLVNFVQSIDASAQTLANLRVALNAVVIETDAANIAQIAARPGVVSVNPVKDYEMDLSETVPYIGAATAQANGVTGAGTVVAVLDSGIDYTHFNLGGSGDLADYDAAYGASPNDPAQLFTTRDGLFPTDKVIEGYDFVGESWPNAAEAPDPDPIDWEGHGTHVADIIAGQSTDGTHVGVAPGAKLLAVKVCSAVSTSCSGIALLQGVDYALDPNGDGSIDDAVDVINMSLGSSYGQKEDDLSLASANAVKAGVVVVASAGNSADRPYILGSPSSTPEVISVAQTQVPSAATFPLVINSPANIAGVYNNTETVDWAPIGAGFTGDVVYVGTACPGEALLADPAGKVALIDRGACAVSLKVDAAANADAIGVLFGLIADGDAVSFSFGGGENFVPTLVIIKAYADAIKANLGAPVNVTVSPANAVPLVGAMVGSSSRGPSYSFNQIKPDIGAPGASVSALAGFGTEEGAFGGTSGAAPMVAGSAALILSAYPNASPTEVRARLMNTGDTNIQTNPATQPGVLAPITRIGGGEVRVDKALGTSIAAWESKSGIASLSFGYQPIVSNGLFWKTVRVTNYGSQNRWLNVTPGFRYTDDAASGAVKVYTPSKVFVRAGKSTSFNVLMFVDGSKLPTWTLDGGPNGGDGSLLQSVEFDGYLTVGDNQGSIALPWQILPRKSAALVTTPLWKNTINNNHSFLKVFNFGVENGNADIYALLGTSPRIDKSELPGAGDNFAIVDLRAVGARYAGSIAGLGDILEVGITTYGIRSHPAYPAEFDVYMDFNGDGVDDGVAYTLESGGFAATGQTLVVVEDFNTGDAAAFFYADADLDSANMRMYIPLGFFGVSAATKMTLGVYAFDNYFTGALTDSITEMVFTPATPKYGPLGTIDNVGRFSFVEYQVVRIPRGNAASPSQSGLLMLYRSQAPGFEADIIKVR